MYSQFLTRSIGMSAESLQVANTILDQLGGHKFKVMTGANTFIDNGKGLTFRLPNRNKIKTNLITINLNGMDLYDITFYNVRGSKLKTLAVKENIYNDQLQDVFTDVTGLYTHL